MDQCKKIVMASEHAGYEMKEKIKLQLVEKGYEVTDLGSQNNEPADYPYIAARLAESVAKGEFAKGILLCGTGIGMSIAAGKVPGIRAALCTDTYMARMTRAHNDANVLCLGAWITGEKILYEIVQIFCETGFDGGRHERRVNQIGDLEKRYGSKIEGDCCEDSHRC